MQSETRVINNCIGLLEQAFELLQRIDDQVYTSPGPLSPRAGIGGHLRHVLDFYQCFLRGIDAGRVDYNLRERDVSVEQNRAHAQRQIGATTAALRSLSANNNQSALLVRTEDDGISAAPWSASSLLRELDFLQSHTIHHYSLIAMLLRSQAIEPDEDFGVAPATLRHWREEAACAR